MIAAFPIETATVSLQVTYEIDPFQSSAHGDCLAKHFPGRNRASQQISVCLQHQLKRFFQVFTGIFESFALGHRAGYFFYVCALTTALGFGDPFEHGSKREVHATILRSCLRFLHLFNQRRHYVE